MFEIYISINGMKKSIGYQIFLSIEISRLLGLFKSHNGGIRNSIWLFGYLSGTVSQNLSTRIAGLIS